MKYVCNKRALSINWARCTVHSVQCLCHKFHCYFCILYRQSSRIESKPVEYIKKEQTRTSNQHSKLKSVSICLNVNVKCKKCKNVITFNQFDIRCKLNHIDSQTPNTTDY